MLKAKKKEEKEKNQKLKTIEKKRSKKEGEKRTSKRGKVGSSTTPCTSSEKNCRERLEKKILRAMIGSLGKVKGKMRRGEV